MTDHEAWVWNGLLRAVEDLGGSVDLRAEEIVFRGPDRPELLGCAFDLLLAVRQVAREHGYATIEKVATWILPVWGEFNDYFYGLERPRGRPRRVH